MLFTNLQIDQELWSIYAWWTSILVLKMMYLTWATGRLRVKHKVQFLQKIILGLIKKKF